MPSTQQKITLVHLLVPVSLIAFVLAMFFAFQMTLVIRDRHAMNDAIMRLEEPFAQAQKISAQFGGLVVGTQKLAGEGHKTAQSIVQKLEQAGIVPPPSAAPQGTQPGMIAPPGMAPPVMAPQAPGLPPLPPGPKKP